MIVKKSFNNALLVFAVIVSILAVGSTFVLLDRKSPTITQKGTPTLGCGVRLDDLLSYGEASDNKNLKAFFIEENQLSDIADKKYLTYVAIDEANNVSKLRVPVTVDSDITRYHIEVLKPLKAQIRDTFKTSGFLVLKNECGWDIEDSFVIEGVDYSLQGEYEALVKAKKHSHVDPIYTTVVVDDFKAPKIVLTSESANDWTNMYYSDEYFLNFVDYVEDDNDDPQTLKPKVTCNWRDVMNPSSSGYMSRTGTYSITYRVTDSEGNTGRTTLRLTLNQVVYNTPTGE